MVSSRMSELGSSEKVRALMHDINGALWVAISILDLTLAEGDAEGCDPKGVLDALKSCLEISALIGQLQRSLADLALVDSDLCSGGTEPN